MHLSTILEPEGDSERRLFTANAAPLNDAPAGGERPVYMFSSVLVSASVMRVSGFVHPTPDYLADTLNKCAPFVDVGFGERLVRFELTDSCAEKVTFPIDRIGVWELPLPMIGRNGDVCVPGN